MTDLEMEYAKQVEDEILSARLTIAKIQKMWADEFDEDLGVAGARFILRLVKRDRIDK